MKEKKQPSAGFRGVGIAVRQGWVGLWLCHVVTYKLGKLF